MFLSCWVLVERPASASAVFLSEVSVWVSLCHGSPGLVQGHLRWVSSDIPSHSGLPGWFRCHPGSQSWLEEPPWPPTPPWGWAQAPNPGWNDRRATKSKGQPAHSAPQSAEIHRRFRLVLQQRAESQDTVTWSGDKNKGNKSVVLLHER